MASIAETYFRLSVEMSEYDRRALSEYIRATSTEILREVYGHNGHVEVVVLEGSTRVWIKAAGISLVTLVVGYGSFRQSIDTLVSDARMFSEKARSQVMNIGLGENEIEVFQRRLGIVGRIQRAMIRIDRLYSEYGKPNERRAELERVKALLFDIVVELDSQDRQLLLSNVPLAIQDDLVDGEAPVRSLTWTRSELGPLDSEYSWNDQLEDSVYKQKKINYVEGVRLDTESYRPPEPTVSFDSKSGKLLRVPDRRTLPRR